MEGAAGSHAGSRSASSPSRSSRAAPAAADVVRCDGPARAGAAGAPELLTGCGRLDQSLGSGKLAGRTLNRLAPTLGVDPPTSRSSTRAAARPANPVACSRSSAGCRCSTARSCSACDRRRPGLGAQQRHRRRTLLPATRGERGRGPLRRRRRRPAVASFAARADDRAGRLSARRRQPCSPGTWSCRPPRPADWNVIVDATSGSVVDSWDAIAYANTASIYDPSPVQVAGTYTGFADGSDADTAALTAARTTGFPLTHLAASVDTLKGDFADLTGDRDRPGSTLPYTPGLGALARPATTTSPAATTASRRRASTPRSTAPRA